MLIHTGTSVYSVIRRTFLESVQNVDLFRVCWTFLESVQNVDLFRVCTECGSEKCPDERKV